MSRPAADPVSITCLEYAATPIGRGRWRAELPDARWCEFVVYDGDPRIAAFGGEVWPSGIPLVFEHLGPDEDAITSRSGPALRAGIELPKAPGATTIVRRCRVAPGGRGFRLWRCDRPRGHQGPCYPAAPAPARA